LKTVLVDASSAILLHKADLLVDMQVAFHIQLTVAVFEELTRHRRPGAKAVARSLRERQIKVVTPSGSAAGSRHLPGSLHRGERDTLLCFLDGGVDFIIIDDGGGAGYCRREAIPYVNALLCPRLLAAAGRLSPSDAQQAMTRISDLGHYSAWIKRYADTCSDADLSAFLP
jgi:predicted nucleic acid-binding protein